VAKHALAVETETQQPSLSADLIVLIAIACLLLVEVALGGKGYGFHRDELQFLDDGLHLRWGFVPYPPLSPLVARIAITLFGVSVWALHLAVAVANMVSLVLVGLMAREMGGRRLAQVLAVVIALPVGIAFSSLFEYNTFDYLAWALTAFFCAKLLRTGNPRWWIAIGASIGLGALAKYSIAFLAVSLLIGLLVLPEQRHFFRSRWLYLGVAAALLIASPNLIWLARHSFITLQMEQFIHNRDIRMGRTSAYFPEQLRYVMFALPLVFAGLVRLLRSRRYRLLAFFFLGPLVLMALARGRGYYLLPAYLPLYSAAAVAFESWLLPKRKQLRILWCGLAFLALALNTAFACFMFVPMAAPGSRLFFWQVKNNPDIGEEVGWPQFVGAVAQAYHSLAPAERTQLAIFAENYGEAGALVIYGGRYGLPAPISGVNSWHDRGYGPFPPENVLTTGAGLQDELRYFETCRLAGHFTPPYGIHNDEFRFGQQILLCSHPRFDWAKGWPDMQIFG
jgi:hypothetical protein